MDMAALTQSLQQNPPLLLTIVAWSLFWKAISLWHAARNNQLAWYIALVLLNTVGILEIIYLIFFRKKKLGYNPR